jgi:hypothetical protein
MSCHGPPNWTKIPQGASSATVPLSVQLPGAVCTTLKEVITGAALVIMAVTVPEVSFCIVA